MLNEILKQVQDEVAVQHDSKEYCHSVLDTESSSKILLRDNLYL